MPLEYYLWKAHEFGKQSRWALNAHRKQEEVKEVCGPMYVFLIQFISVVKFLAIPSLFQINGGITHTKRKKEKERKEKN